MLYVTVLLCSSAPLLSFRGAAVDLGDIIHC
jgi:hypothetical protein